MQTIIAFDHENTIILGYPQFEGGEGFSVMQKRRYISTRFFVVLLILSLAILAQNVNASQQIDVISPDGGENWVAGSSYTIRWTVVETIPTGTYVTIKLQKGLGDNIIAIIASSVPAEAGSYTWVIPTWVDPASDYWVKIHAIPTWNVAYGESARDFTITPPVTTVPQCSLSIVSDPPGATVIYTYQGSSQTLGETPYYYSSSCGSSTETFQITLKKSGYQDTVFSVTTSPSQTTYSFTKTLMPINTAPTASFKATQSSSSLQVQFDASASYDTDRIGTYEWDFGDGSTGKGKTATHTYNEAGTFTVTLTVTDQGTPPMENTISHDVNVLFKSSNPVIGTFTVPTTGEVQKPVSLTAWATDPDGDPLTYSWNFGDGESVTGSTVTHTYKTAQSYMVTLTVTDGKGGTANQSQTIQVSEIKTLTLSFDSVPGEISVNKLTDIVVHVVDANGAPVSGATVNLAVPSGATAALSPPSGVTDSSGIFRSKFVSPEAGPYMVNADIVKEGFQAGTMTVPVVVVDTGPELLILLLPFIALAGIIAVVVLFLFSRNRLQLVVAQKSVSADGHSTIPIKIQFANGFGSLKNQSVDREIALSATSGTIKGVTIPKGSAYASTSLISSRESGRIKLSARYGNQQADTMVDFLCEGGTIDILPLPPEIPADGKSATNLTLRLRDKQGSLIAFQDERTMQLSTTLGTISSTLKVPAHMQEVSTSLVSGTIAGTARVTAILDTMKGEITVPFGSLARRYCMHCGTSMTMGAQSCPACGKIPPSGTDTKACGACGSVIPIAAKYCDKCGAKQGK